MLLPTIIWIASIAIIILIVVSSITYIKGIKNDQSAKEVIEKEPPRIFHLTRASGGKIVYCKGDASDYDLECSMINYFKSDPYLVRNSFNFKNIKRGYFRTIPIGGKIELFETDEGKQGSFFATVITMN